MFAVMGVTGRVGRAVAYALIDGGREVDGFNEGRIEFGDGGANARRGRISLNEAISDLVAKTRAPAQTPEA